MKLLPKVEEVDAVPGEGGALRKPVYRRGDQPTNMQPTSSTTTCLTCPARFFINTLNESEKFFKDIRLVLTLFPSSVEGFLVSLKKKRTTMKPVREQSKPLVKLP